MKSKLLSAFLLSSSFAFADAEKPINETLRDALYAEEVTRDIEGAAKRYEEVVSRYQTQRDFAATALFRLAEVRRKQDRKEDAIKLYQQLITEFPSSEKQVTLARENLTALGIVPPSNGNAPPAAPEVDFEAEELARLEELKKASPDKATDVQEFEKAISLGHIRVITYLLENGFDPNKPLSNPTSRSSPLCLAVQEGNIVACELLIKAGAKLNPRSGYQPLNVAVDFDFAAIADLLIKHGADVNHLEPANPNLQEPQTALLKATIKNTGGMIAKLLAAKADPNKASYSGTSPLHYAVIRKDVELTKLLLEAGADPSAELNSQGDIHLSGTDQQIKGPATSFQIAIQVKAPEILTLLLLQKADQETIQNLFDQVVRSDWADGIVALISAGADVNKSPGVPYLLDAVAEGRLQIVIALLKAGADPNAAHPGVDVISPLNAAMFAKDNGLNIATALIQHGAVPNEATMKGLTKGSHDKVRPDIGVHELLNQRYLIPQLIKNDAVTLLFGAPSRGVIELSKSTGDKQQAPASLPSLLLQGDQPIEWQVLKQTGNTRNFPSNITIWRRGEDGREQSASAFWSGSLHHSEFPPLEWGDVIEANFDLDPNDPNLRQPISTTESLPGDIQWNLQKHVAFPIKVIIDGKEREYRMRGDRLLFDPTQSEIPMIPALELASQLTGLPYQDNNRIPGNPTDWGNVFVSRDGWPDIKLNARTGFLDIYFRLKSGDRLTIPPVTYKNESEKKTAGINAADSRRREIRLKAKDLPTSRAWPAFRTGFDENGITLIQAIAEVLSFRAPDTREPEALIRKYAESHWQSGPIRVSGALWNNPDLSRIVIRRIKSAPDNGEEIINVDLSKAISRPEAEITVEEARKADVILLAGDIVEIPLRADEEEKIWTGLSQAERSFFAKALGGKVQVREMNQGVVVRDLVYSALDFIRTPAGKLPAPPADQTEGTSSMTIAGALGTEGKIIRDGREIPEMVFLRDGDQVQLTKSLPGPRRITPPAEPLPSAPSEQKRR